jgi:hypothetical protein
MLSSAKQNIALETIELFLEILKLDEIAALSNKALGDLLINIAMSSEKLEAGVLNSTDHSLVLLAYEIANNNNINELNNLKDKISLYEETVGGFPPLSMMKYSDIEKDQMPQSREGALKLAIQNHPVIFACKEHIKEAIDMFLSNDCDSVVSVASVNGNHPFRMKKLINNQLINFIDQGFWDMRPRQELPEVYIRNGAIYLINKDQLLKQKQLIGNKCLGYIMNDKDSINIDSEIDLILADLLIKERQSK